MNVGDSQVALELLSKNHPAGVSVSGELTQGLFVTATSQGSCHALACPQSESSASGVKSQNLLLPGEVVS